MFSRSLCLALIHCAAGVFVGAAEHPPTPADALAAMRRATAFMTERVAVNGGYVWYYLPDLSRRWGELEARPTMIWVQAPGTVSAGHVFLDAYHATGDDFYYRAAEQTARALIAGQLGCGGWNYLIDFAGENSLRAWYATVGRHAWRLEEFHRYRGNATFDDSATADATRFLLRFFLEKRDAGAKRALERALQFVLDAQLPNGGWPQRFPPEPGGVAAADDFTGYLTFNDNVTAGNIDLLVQCYSALGDARLPSVIRRAMDVFLLAQGRAPQAGWALQYTPDLAPAAARSYEPRALATHVTAANAEALLRFYALTGDARYLVRIPEALAWLDRVALPADLAALLGGTHPTFVELDTDRPLYLHRTGSNVANGRYFTNDDPHDTVLHYSSSRRLDVAALRARYETLQRLAPAEATRHSLLLHPQPAATFARLFAARTWVLDEATEQSSAQWSPVARVRATLAELNVEGYWPARLRLTSYPFVRPSGDVVAPGDFRRTFVGDDTDTSPFSSSTPPVGISTAVYIRQMSVLIGYVAGEDRAR